MKTSACINSGPLTGAGRKPSLEHHPDGCRMPQVLAVAAPFISRTTARVAAILPTACLDWGVNDFDEVAEMPAMASISSEHATSAILARGSSAISAPRDGCLHPDWGTGRALRRPCPVVPDKTTRGTTRSGRRAREGAAKFWKKMDALKREPAPSDYLSAISQWMPRAWSCHRNGAAKRGRGEPSSDVREWVGIADWRGGLSCAKARLRSRLRGHVSTDQTRAAARVPRLP